MEDEILLSYDDSLIKELREMTEIDMACLVYGETGKKTFITTEFPDTLVYDARVFSEPKNLGGFHVIKDGEIFYMNGILANAMLNGLKICFSNIDCNLPLLQYIRPVLSRRRLVGNDGKEIVAHPTFRILLTAGTCVPIKNVLGIGPIGFRYDGVMSLFGEMRRHVEDTLEFIKEKNQGRCMVEKNGFCRMVCLKDGSVCDCGEFLCGRHFRMLCALSYFLKRLKNKEGIKDSNQNRYILYQGLVSCVLEHESEEVQEYLYVRKPALIFPDMNFVKTESADSALRSLILNIKLRRPTLLVGETGAGKTALVQYLNKNAVYFFGESYKMKVVNMSSDFDGESLIGSYQSIDLDKEIQNICIEAKIVSNKGVKRNRTHMKTIIENSHNKELCERARILLNIMDKKLAFCYKEGILTEAMKNGYWLLVDEINLASEETIGLIEAVLCGKKLVLYETGNFEFVKIHPNFMIFACMNPFGDYGKKKYESRVFNRLPFSDFSYSLDCVKAVVHGLTRNLIDNDKEIAEFYFALKKGVCGREYTNVVEPLITGRTLCRSLHLIRKLIAVNEPFPLRLAFSLFFLTQFDLNSRAKVIELARKFMKNEFATLASRRNCYINEKNHFGYAVTDKVRLLVDDVEMGIKHNFPILLQGDTSTGKTSLVYALADKYNKRVIRINNHEHTDVYDYLGNYVTTGDGIVFKKGPLISALQNGYWVILDELNLAPSDVLEVLNRLLDDNREIYVGELDETVVPHENFRIFATQNINYTGRCGLAKSFRNRFIEVFFYEKDENELSEILERTCKLPRSFIKHMTRIYGKLKAMRNIDSLITLRDLFKWAWRSPTKHYEVFEIGMDILLSRIRNEEDRTRIIGIFHDTFQERMRIEGVDYCGLYDRRYNKGVGVLREYGHNEVDGRSDEVVYDYELYSRSFLFNNISEERLFSFCGDMIITRSYVRLIDLIYKSWMYKEPVMIIGETGIGKTKICEIMASLFRRRLRVINMHNGTESSDFIGNFTLNGQSIEWKDGVLVEALVNGDCLLIDEINLAEDAVLERMNSVLEERRTVYVTEQEKEYRAHDAFRVIATMNPSGDFGKREISPALRNRFTEIYFKPENDEYYEIFDELIDMKLSGNNRYFKDEFRKLKAEYSIRKIELIINHIYNFVHRVHSCEIIEINYNITHEYLWKDVLELLSDEQKNITIENTYNTHGNTYNIIGNTTYNNDTNPYFLKKTIFNDFNFNSKTAKMNLKSILRGLSLGRGILLQGEPGVGKTSIVTSISRMCNIPLLRINLSEQTEMSDLVGSYLPIGREIKFVESELIKNVRTGGWILLDEINLCTQSVSEGLNSMLDYRKTIVVNGEDVKVHENTRIFGTMNPVNRVNGRKELPKSFKDRFIEIYMKSYAEDDMVEILKTYYGATYRFDKGLGLRGNIKLNELALDGVNGRISVLAETAPAPAELYFVDENIFRIGRVAIKYHGLDESYVLAHSQLAGVELFFRCVTRRLPVILAGSVGRTPFLEFASKLLNLKLVGIDCHKETDTCDLLGQYCKTECNEILFEWCNSPLVSALETNSLVVFNTPELVDKCVFDRLSSLFESERFINVFEKGTDSRIAVSPDCMLCLCCDNVSLLSPALLDRCVIVELSDEFSHIDLYKIINENDNSNKAIKFTRKNIKGNDGNRIKICDNIFRSFALIDLSYKYCNNDFNWLDILVSQYRKNQLFAERNSMNIDLSLGNVLLERKIDELFAVPIKEEIEYDLALVEEYKRISACATTVPANYVDLIENLKIKPYLISFIKGIEYSKINCHNVPCNIKELKIAFIKGLRNKRIKDLHDVIYFIDNITSIKNIKEDLKDINYEKYNNYNGILTDDDPLKLIRAEIINEKIRKENKLARHISELAKSYYKYGRATPPKDCVEQGLSTDNILSLLLTAYDKIGLEYDSIIRDIDNKLNRDYGKYKTIVKSLSFCQYTHDPQLRLFLDQFNDVFDAYLVKLFNRRTECKNCHQNNAIQTAAIYEFFAKTGLFTKLMNNEYCRLVYAKLTGKKSDFRDFYLEALLTNKDMETNELKFYNDESFSAYSSINLYDELAMAYRTIDEKSVDLALKVAIAQKTIPQAIETRSDKITIGRDFISCELIDSCPLMSTVEFLIDEIVRQENEFATKLCQPEDLRSIEASKDFLYSAYKTEKSLSIDPNYRYFLYFIDNSEISVESIEYFFYNSFVYEYIDRLFFTEQFITAAATKLPAHHHTLLYNSVLRFKAFEVEAMNTKRIREARICLSKEPRAFEKIIRGYVERFLMIPIISVLDVAFNEPSCQDIHEYKGPAQLLEELPFEMPCECQRWIDLGKHYKKENIAEMLGRSDGGNFMPEVKRMFFYRPVPQHIFSYSEICLAKVYNNIINNINKGYYTEEEIDTFARLLKCGYEYVFPPFLYFIYRVSELISLKVEDGVSFKSGEGLNNTKDEVNEEDIVDDFDNKEAGEEEEDGIDMDNEGDPQSISGEENGESDVDHKDLNDGVKEEGCGDEQLEEGGDEQLEDRGDKQLEEGGDEQLEDGGDEQLEEGEDEQSEEGEDEQSEEGGDEQSEEGEDEQLEGEEDEQLEGGDKQLEGEDESVSSTCALNNYNFIEANLNKEQGCNFADSYDKKVEGDNLEEKDALKEGGDNMELVDGEGEKGSGQVFEKKCNFNEDKSSCAKLANLLKIVLVGNENNKYKGDYKSGKKLNLKKIIPYIASDQRKDKIWLKRLKKEKPKYKIRLFIDNSRSMYDQRLIDNLSLIYYQLYNSFAMLNIPVELFKFGENMSECSIEDLTFSDTTTNIEWIDDFKDGINIILTDGIFQTCRYYNNNFIIIMIDKGNIQKLSKVSVIEGKIFVEKYLSNFTLKYCIAESIDDLEGVFVKALGDIIRNI